MESQEPLVALDRLESRAALEQPDRPDQLDRLVLLVHLVQLDLPVHLVPLDGAEQLEALVRQAASDLKEFWVIEGTFACGYLDQRGTTFLGQGPQRIIFSKLEGRR